MADEKQHACSVCNKRFGTKRGLRNHMSYHSGDRPHACHLCDARFKVRAKLRDHLRLVHVHKVRGASAARKLRLEL